MTIPKTPGTGGKWVGGHQGLADNQFDFMAPHGKCHLELILYILYAESISGKMEIEIPKIL